MADRMPAEIWIGGQVPKGLVPELCGAIRGEYLALEWGDAHFLPTCAEDLLQACREDPREVRLLWLCREEVSWGRFDDLEEFLREHRIAYTRRSYARYEYDAEIAEYRAQAGLEELPADSSGEPIVRASTLRPVEDETEQQSFAQAAAAAVLRGSLGPGSRLAVKDGWSCPGVAGPLEIESRPRRKRYFLCKGGLSWVKVQYAAIDWAASARLNGVPVPGPVLVNHLLPAA